MLNIQNARKAEVGRLAGLQDPAVMAAKAAAEKALREAVQRDPKLRATCGRAWNDIAAALKTLRATFATTPCWSAGWPSTRHLFRFARTLVRLAEENGKPNAERLREYRESNRASLEQALFSPAPIYDHFETAKLADSLSHVHGTKGADNELVAQGAGRQVALATGGRIDRRHEAQGRGPPQAISRRGCQGAWLPPRTR